MLGASPSVPIPLARILLTINTRALHPPPRSLDQNVNVYISIPEFLTRRTERQ